MGHEPHRENERMTTAESSESDHDTARWVYHGTDATHTDQILTDGLQPREATGRSNWSDHDMGSIPGHVYLTRLYAGYFGLCAQADEADDSSDDREPFAVYQIDLQELDGADLFPDEDFIEQASGGRGVLADEIPVDVPNQLGVPDEGIVERTEAIRCDIQAFHLYWRLSLDVMGNISHRGTIPPEAIRQVSIVEPSNQLTWALLDPSISIDNALLTGQKYETYTDWIATGDADPDALARAKLGAPGDEIPDGWQEVMGDVEGAVDEMIAETDIEIRENPAYGGSAE